MGVDKTVSVVVPWSNRPELEVVLARNRTEFNAIKAEILVVNCGGDASMLAAAIKRSGCESIRRLDIPAVTFNKCLALNIGAHFSRGTVLFTLDADIILSPGFLEEALARVSSEAYVSVERVIEMNPRKQMQSYLVRMVQSTELTGRDGKVIRFENERMYFEDGSEAGPGLVMIARKDFFEVGGMNSQLAGWGYEDLDLHVRLSALRGLSHSRFGQAIHLTHGDDKRMLAKTTQAASQQLNMAICYDKYSRGNFMGTLAADVAQWSGQVKEQNASTPDALPAYQ